MRPRRSAATSAALKPVDLHVLLALRAGDRHGYGLVQDLEEQSGGRLRLAPASLYTVLQRLLDWDWIEEADTETTTSGGPPRRVYRLTDAGSAALDSETERLRDLLARLDSGSLVDAERVR
ncbi:MAG TPA: PadR family transcriptional regulator [Thermoanaerobaculia bacterium]|nr:PadR family transcriptional regulator [Thermoanaerobaculia bacterium]